MSVPYRHNYINGEWLPALKGGRIAVVNPANEAVLGSIPASTTEDVSRAVEAALAAFKSWGKTSGAHRAEFLRKISQKVRTDRERLAQLETLDNGKPISEALWDVDDVASCFAYYADLAEKLDERQWQPIELGEDDFKCCLRREALGAVALVTPWNYPMLMATWKVAPALAAGNTAILKPSEVCSVTCLELAAIAHEVGVPPGVFNVVTGYGADAGAPLSSHPGVSKVAFTGSVATGRRVNMAAAANLRPTSMELGGKSALIVFEDADVADAVEWAMFGCFWTTGQICTATSRLILHEDIAPKFHQLLKRRAESIKIGDPLDENSRLGPVVNATQHAKIMEYIETAKREGCVLLTGGGRPAHKEAGHWLQPTVFTGVQPHHSIWREEIFGPVLAATTFSTENEALQLANDHEFGLGAAIISANMERCRRVAAALEAGVVWINCSQPCFCQAPWGGVKNSGFGRELGEMGLEAYLSTKQITSYVSKERWDWFSPDSKL